MTGATQALTINLLTEEGFHLRLTVEEVFLPHLDRGLVPQQGACSGTSTQSRAVYWDGSEVRTSSSAEDRYRSDTIVMCLCDVIDSPVWSDSPKQINFHLVCPADPSGWWFGRLRGREGMFPGNYVEKM